MSDEFDYSDPDDDDELFDMAPMMTPKEASIMCGVDLRTLTRWANDGRFRVRWTPGGQRRYFEEEVRVLADTRARYGGRRHP